MMEEDYTSSQTSVYNIETNILLSTMLYSHYYRYRWRHGKNAYDLPKATRVILAAAAYNMGQNALKRNIKKQKVNNYYDLKLFKLFQDKLI